MLCIAKQCNNVTNREDAILTITTKHKKKSKHGKLLRVTLTSLTMSAACYPAQTLRPPKSDPSRERSVSPPNTRFVVPT